MAPLALLALMVAAASANMFEMEDMQRVRRILKSPVTQRLAETLGLNLPEVPEFDIMANITNLDINALAAQAGSSGCLPEGTQFSAETRDAVADCVAKAYNEVRSNPMGRQTTRRPARRPAQRRRFGRSLVDRIRQAAMERALDLAWTCLAERLSLVAEDGTLSQAGVDAVIDGSTMPDQLKEHKKNMTRVCIDMTPGELTGAAALDFQADCVSRMGGLDCALGVSYQVSPTVGFLTLHGAGKCLCKGAIPPPRAAMAYAACTADGVSTLMRERLAATADAAGRRRRRRDVNMMDAWEKMGGLEAIEKELGIGPKPRPCVPNIFRKCPPPRPSRAQMIMAKLNETLPEVERLAGPLDEAFASIPARANDVASCWFSEMEAVNDDGSVNVDKVSEIAGQFSRPDAEEQAAMQAATARIIEYCTADGSAASVDQFTQCWAGAAAYGCQVFAAVKEAQEKQRAATTTTARPRRRWG